jgi:Zn-dependent M28 family amino/carboxypeptidase
MGMGVLLEIARALTVEGVAPPRNDVVVLLTDAEEAGMLGAEAFTRERAASLGTAVVLNHEARGAWGTPTTFRTTSPNGALLDALARAPGAMAESASEAAFEALPNDTDLTPSPRPACTGSTRPSRPAQPTTTPPSTTSST